MSFLTAEDLMNTMKSILGIGLVIVLLAGCTEQNPITITPYFPDYPGTKPTISRSLLKNNENFQVGYQNGHIRSNRMTLTWAPVNMESFLCYKIYIGEGYQSDVYYEPIETFVTENTSTSTYTELTQNSYYVFKIAALNTSGMYTVDTVQVKTPRFEPPVLATARPDTTDEGEWFVLLIWQNQAESNTGYEVERGDDNIDFETIATVHVVDNVTYQDASVDSGASYYYRIRAINPYEKTEYSETKYVLVTL